MSILSMHPAIRWTVPLAVVGIAIGGTAVATQLSADAVTTLAPRSAAQLLVDVQTARVTAGSGTVVEKADLGLPELPSIGGAGSSDLTSLIAGSHTLRVWYSGQSKARVALMGTLGESDIIRNGQNLWTWSSDGNSANHRVLPAESSTAKKAPTVDELGGVAGSNLTPQQVADKALAAIDPTTVVSTSGSARVAGRDAYELVLSPKDSSSLVGQVRIAIDAIQHVPLRVQVFAKNATSASVEVGFTQVSFAQPADSEFRFVPPPGVKVTESGSTPASPADKAKAKAQSNSTAKSDSTEPIVTGTGWTAVVQEKLAAPADALATKAAGQSRSVDQLVRLLGALPRVSGSWGSGRLLGSKLFNVLLTDDGRVLVGAVAPNRLYQVAGQAKS